MEILKRANAIKTAQQAAIESENRKKQKEYEDFCAKKKAEFEQAFADYLPLLNEAGIDWYYHSNNRNYPISSGGYIVFIRDVDGLTRTLKMDFSSGNSYRYYQDSTFDEWNKEEKFILFIADGLLYEQPKVLDFSGSV